MSNRHKNFLSYTWILAIIIVIIFLIIDLVVDVLYPIAKLQPLSYAGKISCYYAYFTVETNYLIVVYFIVSMIKKVHDKYSVIKFEVGLALIVYITITMIIYWGAAYY